MSDKPQFKCLIATSRGHRSGHMCLSQTSSRANLNIISHIWERIAFEQWMSKYYMWGWLHPRIWPPCLVVRASSTLTLAPEPEHRWTLDINPRLSSQSDPRSSSVLHSKLSPYFCRRWTNVPAEATVLGPHLFWLFSLSSPLLFQGPLATLPHWAQHRRGGPPFPSHHLRRHHMFDS